MDLVKKRYTALNARILSNQESKIRKAVVQNHGVTIFVLAGEITDSKNSTECQKNGVLLVTPKQLARFKSTPRGDWVKISMSPTQLSKNRGNGEHVSYVTSVMENTRSSSSSDIKESIGHGLLDNDTIDVAGINNNNNEEQNTIDSSENVQTSLKTPVEEKSKSIGKKRKKAKEVDVNDDDDTTEHYIYRTEDCRHIRMTPESNSGNGIWLRPFDGTIPAHQRKYMKKNGEGVYLRRNSEGEDVLRKVGDSLEFGRF